MDFWKHLRIFVPIDIPEYLREVLLATGFDNFLALECLDENIMNEIEKHAETLNKKILLGHKIMLFKIRDIFKSKGIDVISKLETNDTATLETSVGPKGSLSKKYKSDEDSNIDLNAEELLLRNRVKELFKKLQLDNVSEILFYI